jgi:hypothetical protein
MGSRGPHTPRPGQLMLSNAAIYESPVDSSPPTAVRPDQIVAAWQQLRDRQNEDDRHQDLEDLRQIMRRALQTRNDVELIDVLQVSRVEMPEGAYYRRFLVVWLKG